MMINNEKMKNRFSYSLICITIAFVLSGSVLAGCSGNAAGYEDRCENIKWTPIGNYRNGNSGS
ncbi:MAG: hypothetical protein K6E53_14235 [Lachnospiraceae bacterium]|nr:hypothetical protein [Lachnospiraceae bacterium]